MLIETPALYKLKMKPSQVRDVWQTVSSKGKGKIREIYAELVAQQRLTHSDAYSSNCIVCGLAFLQCSFKTRAVIFFFKGLGLTLNRRCQGLDLDILNANHELYRVLPHYKFNPS